MCFLPTNRSQPTAVVQKVPAVTTTNITTSFSTTISTITTSTYSTTSTAHPPATSTALAGLVFRRIVSSRGISSTTNLGPALRSGRTFEPRAPEPLAPGPSVLPCARTVKLGPLSVVELRPRKRYKGPVAPYMGWFVLELTLPYLLAHSEIRPSAPSRGEARFGRQER